MIEIVKEKTSTKKKTPYYKLKYEYMIGDANGQTSETVKVSHKNPYVERFVKLLNKLKPVKGTWGIVFEYNFLDNLLLEKQITQDDYLFLNRMMGIDADDADEYDEDEEEKEFSETTNVFKVEKENEKYANEFREGVTGETEYSFLVFEGVKLTYYDEYGKSHKTKIKK